MAVLVQASQALTEAVMVPSDSCSEGRAACQMMFSAIATKVSLLNLKPSEQNAMPVTHSRRLSVPWCPEEDDDVVGPVSGSTLALAVAHSESPLRKHGW
jgi:hypothetical protein